MTIEHLHQHHWLAIRLDHKYELMTCTRCKKMVKHGWVGHLTSCADPEPVPMVLCNDCLTELHEFLREQEDAY